MKKKNKFPTPAAVHHGLHGLSPFGGRSAVSSDHYFGFIVENEVDQVSQLSSGCVVARLTPCDVAIGFF